MAGSVAGDAERAGGRWWAAGGGTEGKRVRVREGGIEGQEGRDCRIHRRQEGYTVERGVSTLL